MPLTVLPAIDIRAGRAVRPVQGRPDDTVDADPLEVADTFAAAGATWLHVVDLDAAYGGPAVNRRLVAEVRTRTGLPVQASGGVQSAADIETALEFGASRVVVGTLALADPEVVVGAIETHGDAVAIGLDARGRSLRPRGSTAEVGDLFDTLAHLTAHGVGRIVFTDVDRDGMLNGPPVARLREVTAAADARVTASGGVSSLDDLRTLAAIDRVDEVIVGKALYAGRFTLAEAIAAAGAQ